MNPLDLYRLDQKSHSFLNLLGQAPDIRSSATNVISPLDSQFGAKANSTTNDGPAIQAALDYANVRGSAVYIPMVSTGYYYMGSTKLTLSGNTRLYGDNYTSLVWDAAHSATAIALAGGYNILENLILFKPKSVAAPNSAIIAVSIRSAINRLNHVRTDQTSAGNNSGWYTGVKISDISNTLDGKCEFYTYDIAVLISGGSGSRNDTTIKDSIIVSQNTAGIKMVDGSTLSVTDCDIEGGTYGIWINTGSAESAGNLIAGNYFQANTDSSIFADANASFPIRGLNIDGNEINNSAGTNAVRLSNTVGVAIDGNYLKGGTNYLKLENTNTDLDLGGNFRSGSLTAGGTLTPYRLPLVQSFTPTLNSFTIVPGTGGITSVGTFTRYSNLCHWTVVISGTGTATIASTANTSNISMTGMPAPLREGTAVVQNGSITFASTGCYTAPTGLIWPPTWAAFTPSTGGNIILSGWYDI